MTFIAFIYYIKEVLINIKLWRIRLLIVCNGPNFVRWPADKNPQPCFKESNISLLECCDYIFFSTRHNLSFETSETMTASVIISLLYPSRIKGINSFGIFFAWLILFLNLQMEVNIRGLEGTGESNS